MLTSFYWVVEDKVAGSGMPGVYESEETGLQTICQEKIDHVVSLIEDNPSLVFEKIDVSHSHFPIPDMGVPGVSALKTLLEDISSRVNNHREKILVHCKAGMGRTGLVLASYLVFHGMDGQEAIDTVRKKNRGYIQNSQQERFVKMFALAV